MPGIKTEAQDEVERQWKSEIKKNKRKAEESMGGESEYERKRFAQIQENFKMLENIGLTANLHTQLPNETKRVIQNKTKVVKAKSARREKAAPIVRRSSRRIRGEQPKITKGLTDEQVRQACNEQAEEDEELVERHKTCEEYWKPQNVVAKYVNEKGRYEGWVEEGVRQRCKIESNADDAWENNGGGKFSFSNPTGSKSKGKKSGPIKEIARGMLRKNPNAYFYRHTEPGVEHWQGDWTEEENELFLKTAKEYGVGNKWGLFSSHIPHRVGYQCSQHYRSYFVGQGIIWDDHFLFNSYGETIWNKGGRR